MVSTVTGQVPASDHGLARVLEVGLAVHSAAVLATLAGELGGYFR